ncbi:MAG: leucyl aminopeptidase family protein [Burkholderiales bacterium]|nr:leucyl aminopeptidase family protein [Burkholderiales bacterium]
MLAKVNVHSAALTKSVPAKVSHLLVVLPKQGLSADVPGGEAIKKLLQRRQMKASALEDTPLAGELGQGGKAAWAMIDDEKSIFERQTAVRKALQLLLTEGPRDLHIAVAGSGVKQMQTAEIAVYCALVNGRPLPTRKKDNDAKILKTITVHGVADSRAFDHASAVAEGNYLARMLTGLPANELTPAIYRERIAALAEKHRWKREEFDLKKLAKMGAGAFTAVAQGSPQKDAAIVHLRYSGPQAKQTIALVGKGICFDTGGHNLKPARGMFGMHQDMNGSAVALGILQAATRLKLPINIDCWLAIAENHLSPAAYKQNDVVTAMNGTSIEIVHTDAEGRLVLADCLSLAARHKPDAIIDFATLTGTMVYALGNRYSGVFCNREKLLLTGIEAGKASGERMNPFPLDADYDVALKSDVADTKQCVLAGEADHILGARFLLKFVEDLPWIHVDLSAASCEEGLGAVGTQITGFGVGWGVEMLMSMRTAAASVH